MELFQVMSYNRKQTPRILDLFGVIYLALKPIHYHKLLIACLLINVTDFISAGRSQADKTHIHPVHHTTLTSDTSAELSTLRMPVNITVPKREGGHWFNKGVTYGKCSLLDGGLDDYCQKSISGQKTSTKFDIMKPDYGVLLKNVMCTLKRVNCPTSDSKSFQIHDIPCQSTCFSLLTLCAQLQNAAQKNNVNLPINCPTNIKYLLPRSQKRWLWDKSSVHSTNIQNNVHYLRSNANSLNAHKFYPHQYNTLPNTRRYARYPNVMPHIPSQYVDSLATNVRVDAPFNFPSSLWINRREPRGINENYVINDYSSARTYTPTSVKRVRPATSAVSRQTKSALLMQHFDHPATNLQFAPKNNHIQHTQFVLNEEDCWFLPPGGCNTWSDQLTNMHQLKNPHYQSKMKLNSGCSPNLAGICNAMFPHTFSRQQWLKGNFTVAAIIRISGTLWWFGRNGRFQPLYRFHILKTFDSDIHPYDEKMILTYSWPYECICPDEIILGKKYLMLTHSFKSRQTLHIGKNTVFLSRVKRYTKRLACWKGACSHRLGQNRRRRFHIHRNNK